MNRRLHSVGQILDRSVTISLQNFVPLGWIVGSAVLADESAKYLLSQFAFPHQLSQTFSHPTAVLALLSARAVVFVMVDASVAALAVMASAVVIDDALIGIKPNVGAALAEAVGEFGQAMLLLLHYLLPIVISVGVGAAGAAVCASPNPFAIGLGALMIAVAVLGLIFMQISLSIGWVHLILRNPNLRASGKSVFCAIRPRVTAALTILAAVALGSPAAIADWVLSREHVMPVAASDAVVYLLDFVSGLLLCSFVTVLYLEVCGAGTRNDV